VHGVPTLLVRMAAVLHQAGGSRHRVGSCLLLKVFALRPSEMSDSEMQGIICRESFRNLREAGVLYQKRPSRTAMSIYDITNGTQG
jgi:hypothetical protein